MATTPSPFTLDPYSQTMVDLWHAASRRLTVGPESDDILVQAAGHTVLAWLRHDAATPRALLGAFGQPAGPLVPQLRFVGSLIHDPARALPAEPPRLGRFLYAHSNLRGSAMTDQHPSNAPGEAARPPSCTHHWLLTSPTEDAVSGTCRRCGALRRFANGHRHAQDGDYGIPPTGKRVQVDAMSLLRLEGGKIAENWTTWDTLGILQQLGIEQGAP